MTNTKHPVETATPAAPTAPAAQTTQPTATTTQAAPRKTSAKPRVQVAVKPATAKKADSKAATPKPRPAKAARPKTADPKTADPKTAEPKAAAPKAKSEGGKAGKKSVKPRPVLVRDSFTMPEADFALIARLKATALGGRRAAKKSELLRAGLQLLAALDAKALVKALDHLEAVKTGRPKKGH